MRTNKAGYILKFVRVFMYKILLFKIGLNFLVSMMNIIVATSRGRGLSALEQRQDTVMSITPGGETEDLVQTAIKELEKLQPADTPHRVYFVSGLPDVTTKLKRRFYLHGKLRKYQEVIFPESPTEAHDRVMGLICQAEADIRRHHAIPVFTTITPSSLIKWNLHRLHGQFTTHLNYRGQYHHMQDNLHKAVQELNRSIHILNSSNGVVTPKLAQHIMYTRRGHWRYRYGKLVDGVHGTKKTNEAWTKIMTDVMDKNARVTSIPAPMVEEVDQPISDDSGDDSDESNDSDKRSWIY